MTIPGVTPFGGTLPAENEPASFPARAEALFTWLTADAAPEINAVATGINTALNDNGTVLDTAGAAIALTTNANTIRETAGTGNAYTITPAVAVAAYADGQIFMVRPNRASTGAVTLQVGALAAVPVRKIAASGSGFVELASGDWQEGEIHIVTYRSSQFELLTVPLNTFVRVDENLTITGSWTFSAAANFTTALADTVRIQDAAAEIRMLAENTASTHNNQSIVNSASELTFRTLSSTGIIVSNDYIQAKGASGVISHSFRVAGTERVRVTEAGILTQSMAPLSGGEMFVNADLIPGGGVGNRALGKTSTFNESRWGSIFLNSSPNVSSDARLKEDFAPYTETDLAAARLFEPQTFRLKASGKPTSGYVAQQIIEAFEQAGLSPKDAAQRPVDLGLMEMGEDGMWGMHYELVNALRIKALIA